MNTPRENAEREAEESLRKLDDLRRRIYGYQVTPVRREVSAVEADVAMAEAQRRLAIIDGEGAQERREESRLRVHNKPLSQNYHE